MATRETQRIAAAFGAALADVVAQRTASAVARLRRVAAQVFLDPGGPGIHTGPAGLASNLLLRGSASPLVW